jgi:uncharacterized protein (DUF305 family)
MSKFKNAQVFFITFAAIATLSLASFSIAQTTDNSTTAYMEADKKMMANMQGMKMSGDADKDFVMMMMPHHEGAIDMAQVELKYGKDPLLLSMAKKIVDAQKAEIEEMKKWQKDHGM